MKNLKGFLKSMVGLLLGFLLVLQGRQGVFDYDILNKDIMAIGAGLVGVYLYFKITDILKDSQ